MPHEDTIDYGQLAKLEKETALISLRLETLERGAHLISIVGDLTEIKELLKGSPHSKGLLSKVEQVEDAQSKMIWMISGFALCIPTFIALMVFIFPKLYDIRFTPHNLSVNSATGYALVVR